MGATDINGDGYSDMVSRKMLYWVRDLCLLPMETYWQLGSASGLSAIMNSVEAQGPYRGNNSVVPGDINGDGYGDVLMIYQGKLERYFGGPFGLEYNGTIYNVSVYDLLSGF